MPRSGADAGRRAAASGVEDRGEGRSVPSRGPSRRMTRRLRAPLEAGSANETDTAGEDTGTEDSFASAPVIRSESSGGLFSRAPSMSESSPSTAATALQDDHLKQNDTSTSNTHTRSSSSLPDQEAFAIPRVEGTFKRPSAMSAKSRGDAIEQPGVAVVIKSNGLQKEMSHSPRRGLRSPQGRSRTSSVQDKTGTPLRREHDGGRRGRDESSSLSDVSDAAGEWATSGSETEQPIKKVPAWKKKTYMTTGLYCNTAKHPGPRTVRQLRGRVFPMPIHHGLAILEEPRGFRIPEHYFDLAGVQRSKLEAKRKPPPYRKIRTNVYTSRPKLSGEIPVCHCDPTSDCGDNCMNRLLQFICNPKSCPCGERCTNGSLGGRPRAKFEIHNYGERGFGVKALEDIAEGTFIAEYCGEVIDMDEATRRVASHYKDTGNYYFLDYDTAAGEVLDAGLRGNETRFINHSCEPNCFVERWLLCGTDEALTGEFQIGISALRDIKAGEELTYDYGWSDFTNSVDADDAPTGLNRCLCGSANCSGYLGGKKKRPAPPAPSQSPNKPAKKATAAKRKLQSRSGMPASTTGLARKGSIRTKQKIKAAIARTAAARKEKQKERKRLKLPPASPPSPRLGSLPIRGRGPRTPGKLFTKPAKSLFPSSALEKARNKTAGAVRRTRRSLAAAQSLQSILGITDSTISSDAVFKELQDREDARVRARNARRARTSDSDQSDGDADDENDRSDDSSTRNNDKGKRVKQAVTGRVKGTREMSKTVKKGAEDHGKHSTRKRRSRTTASEQHEGDTADGHISTNGRHSRRSNAAAQDTSDVLGVDASKLAPDAFFKALHDEAEARKRARKLERAAANNRVTVLPARERVPERTSRRSGAATEGLNSLLGLDVSNMSSDAVFKAMQDREDAQKRTKLLGSRETAHREQTPVVPSSDSVPRVFSAQPSDLSPSERICAECACTEAPGWRRSQDKALLLCNRCWQRTYQRSYREKKKVDRELGLPTVPRKRVRKKPANANAAAPQTTEGQEPVTTSVTGFTRWLSSRASFLTSAPFKRSKVGEGDSSGAVGSGPTPGGRVCTECNARTTPSWRRSATGTVICNKCWQKDYTKRKSGERRAARISARDNSRIMKMQEALQLGSQRTSNGVAGPSGSRVQDDSPTQKSEDDSNSDRAPARLGSSLTPSLSPVPPMEPADDRARSSSVQTSESRSRSPSPSPPPPPPTLRSSKRKSSNTAKDTSPTDDPVTRPSKRSRRVPAAKSVEGRPAARSPSLTLNTVAKAQEPKVKSSESKVKSSDSKVKSSESRVKASKLPPRPSATLAEPSKSPARRCVQCGATTTSTWRKNDEGLCICNRCGQKLIQMRRAKLKMEQQKKEQEANLARLKKRSSLGRAKTTKPSLKAIAQTLSKRSKAETRTQRSTLTRRAAPPTSVQKGDKASEPLAFYAKASDRFSKRAHKAPNGSSAAAATPSPVPEPEPADESRRSVSETRSTRSRPSVVPVEVGATALGHSTSRRSPVERVTPVPRPRRTGGGRWGTAFTLPPVLSEEAAAMALAEAERRYLLEQEQQQQQQQGMLEAAGSTNGDLAEDGARVDALQNGPAGVTGLIDSAGSAHRATNEVGEDDSSDAGKFDVNDDSDRVDHDEQREQDRASEEEKTEDKEDEDNESRSGARRARRSNLGTRCELCGVHGASWRSTPGSLRAICHDCQKDNKT